MSQKYTRNPTKILYAFIAFTAGAGLWAIDYAEPPAYINAIIIGLIVLLIGLTVYMWRKNKEKLVNWVLVYTIINGDLIALFLLIGSWALLGANLTLGLIYLSILVGSIALIHLIPRQVAYLVYGSRWALYIWLVLSTAFIFISPRHSSIRYLEDEVVAARIGIGFVPFAILLLLLCHSMWVYIKYPDWTVDQWKSSK